MSKDVGKVSIRPMGAWNAETAYEALDVVTYNGGSFISRKGNTGVTPGEEEYWMTLGVDGNKTDAEQITYSDSASHVSGHVGKEIYDLKNRTSAAETQETVLSARMDSFTKLEEGSTTGDAELTDIRVMNDGTTASTAGDAVRTQIANEAAAREAADSELNEDLVHIKDMTSAEEQAGTYAEYHLGFYLDANGDLCQKED